MELYTNPLLRAVKPFTDTGQDLRHSVPSPNRWSDKVPSREMTIGRPSCGGVCHLRKDAA